jgi:hypothetical protein
MSAKFKEISRQLPVSLLRVSAATRELWWTIQNRLELRWGRTMNHKIAAAYGTLFAILPCISNQ